MNRRLLFAIVSTAFVEQAVITIARVATTYRAVELDLSVVWLGVITAVYAVLPIVIGVPIGRFIDRGYDAVTTWMGGGLLIVGCAGFVLFPNLAGVLVATAIIGTAHLLFVVSQQIQCTRCGSGPGAMERAIGNYMVANAAGQGVGPYIVALAGGSASVPPTHLLFAISLGGAVLTMAFAFLTQSTGAHKLPVDRVKVPLRDLLFAPGLTTIIVVSVVTVVAQDLIVVYLPLLGSERGLSVDAVGTLLAIRAVASMLSRLIYARLHVAFGRIPLTLTSTFVSAVAYALLAFPLPLPVLYAAIAVAGFALSISITASIAGVLTIASGGAIGTANSLRTMASRIGQSIIPIVASLVAAATGTGSIFVIIGIGLAASGAAVRFDSKRTDSSAR
ncbi:MAG: MFS transporter [Xanthobacteraceae bacterium]|jgi:predicted MFS family arabinose efflux permease